MIDENEALKKVLEKENIEGSNHKLVYFGTRLFETHCGRKLKIYKIEYTTNCSVHTERYYKEVKICTCPSCSHFTCDTPWYID